MSNQRHRVIIRQGTLQLFQDHKWLILIRDHENDPWRIFGNSLSGRPYRYQTLDKAIYALKTIQRGRYRIGNAKLTKAAEFNENVRN